MSNESMPTEESGQAPEVNREKKFTSFQKIITIILVVLTVVLAGFLVAYVSKNTDDKQTAMTESIKTEPSTGNNIGTNTIPSDNVSTANSSSSGEPSVSNVPVSEEIKKPDLYVKSYDLSEVPKIENEFTAKIVIGNKGTVASQNFNWEWWSTSSEHDCKGSVDSLSAGGTKLVECKYTYDDADEYSTKFIVDSKDSINESDENNNVSTKKIEVAKKADLYVSDYEFNHDPKMGEEFTVSIKIKNKGETDAEDFYWEWWPTVTGSRACHEKVDSLKAGESETVECDYTYGGWANYTTKAVVDSDTDVDESDETNNAYTENIIPIH